MQRVVETVLLGGSVRPTPFSQAIRRSVLDLPCSKGRTLMDAWCDEVASLASFSRAPIPAVRVLTNQDGAHPEQMTRKDVLVHFDRDPAEWRGTGGLLRDLAQNYRPDDFLLVANAAQVLLKPLVEITANLLELNADAAVAAHEDGSPVTLMLVRCGCLASVPEVGFVDMKEQALAALSSQYAVKVAKFKNAVSQGIRSADSYLRALRAVHQHSKGGPEAQFESGRESAFYIVEAGAEVAPDAVLHDSVVLRGTKVAAGAILVRSLVCPGATADGIAADQMISGADSAVALMEPST